MIYGAEQLGEQISQIHLAMEFRKFFDEFSSKHNEIMQDFFLYNDKLELQFDGLLMLYVNLCSDRPNFDKENSYFNEFIVDKCGRLTVIQKIIIHHLNVLKIDNYIHNIVDNPFDYGELADEQEQDNFKESIDKIINEDSDQIFKLINSLRDKFLDSNLFKTYCNALNNGKNLELFKLNIQSLFYIIKQIIYQNVRDNEIKEINENNIIKFNRNREFDGNFFDIRFQPSKISKIRTNEIVKIVFENNKYYGFVTLMTFSFSREKGTLIRIKGEILNEDGLNVKSQNNLIIDEHLKKYY